MNEVIGDLEHENEQLRDKVKELQGKFSKIIELLESEADSSINQALEIAYEGLN